jgi:hypothetical protein
VHPAGGGGHHSRDGVDRVDLMFWHGEGNGCRGPESASAV